MQRALQPEQQARPAGARPAPVIATPSAFAAASSSSWRRQPSPRTCTSENDSGRPDSSAMRRKIANSASTSAKSETTCSTPRPVAPIAVGDADQLVGLGGERRRGLARAGAVVERARRGEAERAGLDRLRAASRAIAAMSSGGRRLAPRAALAHHVQPQRAVRHLHARRRRRTGGRRARRGTRGTTASSTPGPRASTAPGMSSTPSISSMSRSWSAGCTGAKPTPQLPTTTVVTPCHDDGIMRSPHDAWPS